MKLSRPTRTIRLSPLTPQAMLPATKNAMPPNMRRSATSERVSSTARTRAASASS